MKRIILLTLLMLAAKMTLAQAVQFSQPIQTSGPNVPTSGGALPQTLWVANAKVVVCAHVTPASMQTYVNCLATPITTYTDSSMATSCPLSPTIAQMVELPGIACTASSGVASTVSFWAVSGTYDYYVISSYGTFGPYNISQGGGGGGGGGVNPGLTGQNAYYAASGTTVSGENGLGLTVPVQPSTAPTVALGSAGNVTGTNLAYGVTCNNSTGTGFLYTNEFSSNISPSSQQVLVTNIPTCDATTTSRYLCRGPVDPQGSHLMYLVATIADNVTTTYTDNTATLSTFCPWTPSSATIVVPGLSTPVFSAGASALGIGNFSGAMGYASLGTMCNAGGNNGGTHNVCYGLDALASSLGPGSNGNLALGVHALGSLTGNGWTYNSAGGFQSFGGAVSGNAGTCFGALCLSNLQNTEGSTGYGYAAGMQDSANNPVTLCYGCSMIGNDARPLANGSTDESAFGNGSRGHGSYTYTFGDQYTTDYYFGSNSVGNGSTHSTATDASGTPAKWYGQGLWTGWNASGGFGEGDFVNNTYAGLGGFMWYCQYISPSGTDALPVPCMTMGPTGIISGPTWEGQVIGGTWGGTGLSNFTQYGIMAAATTTTLGPLIPNTWTTGHTFVPVWQPSGSALAPVVVDANTLAVSTAANLSGTPALPNGTTGTTQMVGDNTTKLATDAFVIANAGGVSGLSGMTAGQVPIAATASTVTSSKAIQGTDTNLMSSGTISGTSVLLCTDANGGATTASCPAGGSGVVTAAAQYDVPYYTQAGSTAQVGGAAIAGFQYDSTGGAPAAATQGNLGTLINVTSGQALISGGSGSAVTGKALAGSGAGLTTGPTTTVSGDVVTTSGTGGQIADSGTLLTALAPLASPAFTGTPTFASGFTSVTAGTGAVGSATKWFSGIYLGTGSSYYTLLSPAVPSASYTLTVPAIAGADTLATLGLAQTFSGKITFTPTATIAGLNVGSYAGNPSSPVNGDLWYNSTGNALNAQINGATVSLGAGGGCSNNCTISSTAVGTVPLTVSGFSSGQTADLLDIYDYATHAKDVWVDYYGVLHVGFIQMTNGQFNVANSYGLHFWQGGGGDYTGTNPFIDVMNTYGIVAASATANPVTMQIGGYLEYTGTMTTGSWTQFALIGKLGNSSSTNVYNSTVPMEELKLSPTINVSTSSTGYYCEICSLPTETSVGAGVTNYFIKHAASGGSLGTPNYAVTEGGFESVVGTQSVGTKFTTTGCSISSTTGGATVGKFTLGANSCSAVITMNGATGLTASNGWSCHANDETTAAGNTLLYFSANSATTATLSVPATAGTTDVIDFACSAY
jgi:hypothetical protein